MAEVEADNMFASAESLISFMEGITKYLDKLFGNLKNASQAEVDIACEKASAYVNGKVAVYRAEVVKGCHQQYLKATDMMGILKILAEPPSVDLGAIGSYLTSLAEYFTKPYEEAVMYIVRVTSLLQRLTTAMLTLISYKPPIQTGISFDKLEIKAEPVTVQEIITGEIVTPST